MGVKKIDQTPSDCTLRFCQTGYKLLGDWQKENLFVRGGVSFGLLFPPAEFHYYLCASNICLSFILGGEVFVRVIFLMGGEDLQRVDR